MFRLQFLLVFIEISSTGGKFHCSIFLSLFNILLNHNRSQKSVNNIESHNTVVNAYDQLGIELKLPHGSNYCSKTSAVKQVIFFFDCVDFHMNYMYAVYLFLIFF